MLNKTRSFITCTALLAMAACTGEFAPGNSGNGGGNGSGVDAGSGGGNGDGTGTGDGTGDGTGNGDGETAHAFFDRKVAPALQQACGLCHAGDPQVAPTKFMGASAADPSTYYDSILRDDGLLGGFDPALASLITHRHSGLGVEFSAEQEADVTTWLMKEKAERGADAGPAPSEILGKFSGCMELTSWEATRANTIGNLPTSAGNCQSCHGYGAAGVYLNRDSAITFQMNRYQLFLEHMVKVQGGAVIINRDRLASKSEDPGHPQYAILSDDPELPRLQQFVDLTNARVLANDPCTAIGFPAL